MFQKVFLFLTVAACILCSVEDFKLDKGGRVFSFHDDVSCSNFVSEAKDMKDLENLVNSLNTLPYYYQHSADMEKAKAEFEERVSLQKQAIAKFAAYCSANACKMAKSLAVGNNDKQKYEALCCKAYDAPWFWISKNSKQLTDVFDLEDFWLKSGSIHFCSNKAKIVIANHVIAKQKSWEDVSTFVLMQIPNTNSQMMTGAGMVLFLIMSILISHCYVLLIIILAFISAYLGGLYLMKRHTKNLRARSRELVDVDDQVPNEAAETEALTPESEILQ